MADDVVGLRYISEGLPEALREIKQYQSAVSNIGRAESGSANASARAGQTRVRSAQDAGRAAVKAEQDTITALGRTIQMQDRSARAAQQKLRQEAAAIQQSMALKRRAEQDEMRALSQLGAQMQQMIQLRQRSAAVNAQYAGSVQAGSTRVNQMGVVTQQAGYQIGDFLVQIQSGTNAFVAFGQQATQLVGVLPLIAPQLGLTSIAAIGLSTALGIGIPLATALGAAWMRTSGAGATAEDQLKSLTDATSAYTEQVKLANSSNADLEKSFGASAGRIREIAAVLQQLRQVEAIDALKASLEGLAGTLSITMFDSFRGFAANAKGELRKVQAEFGVTDVQAKAIIDSFKAFAAAEGLDGAVQAAVGLNDVLINVFGSAEAIPPALREAAINAGLIAQEAAKADAEVQRMTLTWREINDLVNDIAGVDLAGAFNQAAASVDSMNRRLSITLGRIGSILSAIGNIGFDTIAIQAETAALRAGQSRGQANVEGRLAQERARLSQAGEVGPLAEAALQTMRKTLEENAAAQAALTGEIDARKEATGGASRADRKAAKELEKLREEVEKLNFDADPVAKYNAEIERLNKLVKLGLTDGALAKGIADANEELAKSNPLVRSFSDAFEGFLNGSIRSFKDFAKKIFQDFRNLLTQMIVTAARNKIMMSIGIGGSVAGGAAQAATGGGGILSRILGGGGGAAGGGSIFGGAGFLGLGGGAGSLFGGAGLLGAGGGTGFLGLGAGSGLAGALGGGAFGAAASVALPILGAVGLIASAFKKKRTLLDTGVSGNIGVGGADLQQFQTVNTKRFFGLSSKTRTTTSAADAALAGPIQQTTQALQQSAITAAQALGFGAQAFNGFSYQFRLSLKDMTGEQATQAVTAELTRMGDTFAAMIPHVSSLNELLAVAENRFQLENRLLALQGREAEVLARNRERELAATNELNRPLLRQIYALEDQAMAAQAAEEALRRAQERLEGLLQANLFATAADRQFAATSPGFTRAIPTALSPEERSLLTEVVTAIREGNINNARLLTDLKRIEERRDLEPTV